MIKIMTSQRIAGEDIDGNRWVAHVIPGDSPQGNVIAFRGVTDSVLLNATDARLLSTWLSTARAFAVEDGEPE